MRIVLVGRYQSSERLTGPEKFAKRLFTSLQNTEHDVVFFDYFYRSGGIYNRLFGHENISENVARYGIIPLLVRLVRERPDVVHFVTVERFNIPLLLLRSLLRGRFVATVHGDAVAETRAGVKGGWKDRWAERLMMRQCDRIVAVSGRHLAEVRNRYPSVAGRSTAIAHGADGRFTPSSERRYGEGPLRAVMMERPSFVEGIGELIAEKMRTLAGNGIVLTVIGTTRRMKDDPVRTVPPMESDTLAEFLKEQHVVVNGASCETFSIFTAECMAAGLVPVVNPNIGVSEYIQDGVSGVVVSAGDTGAYVAALLRLEADRAMVERLSRGATEAVRGLDWPSIAQAYTAVYSGNGDV